MGYSKSLAAVKRVGKLLDQMMNATDTGVSWLSNNSHMLAYHLRQGMAIAEKQNVEPYQDLKKRFIIRDKGNRVIAELREETGTITALQQAMTKVILENLASATEIVGAAITHKASEMYFPDADLTEEELGKVYAWATKKEYFIVYSDNGVTMTKTDPGELRWEPKSS